RDGAGGRERIPARPAVYAALAAGNGPASQHERRRKLGWRGGGSGYRDSLCPFAKCLLLKRAGIAGSIAEKRSEVHGSAHLAARYETGFTALQAAVFADDGD